MKKSILLFVILIVSTSNLFGQDLGERLERVDAGYAKLYLQPLVDAIGTNLNSNYFYTAKVPFSKYAPSDFHIGIRLRVMNTFLGSSDERFNYEFEEEGEVGGNTVTGTYRVTNAPTVFGEDNAAIAKFYYNGTYYPDNDRALIGGVVKTTLVPLILPEINIGSVYGTDASFVLFPSINISDFGKFSFYGFTLRHNLSHYLQNPEFDFAIQGGYNSMSLTESNNNDLWKSTSFFVNGQVSKEFSHLFTGYAALQYEKFSADLSYNYVRNGVSRPTVVTIDGDNNFRGVIGGTIRTGFFAFNLDANIGSRFAISSGLNFIIR